MEAQASLVRTYGAVELDAVARVGLHLSLIVHPGNAEGEDAVRLHHPLDDFRTLELRMTVVNFLNRFENLLYSLKVLAFSRILGLKL